MLKVISFNIRCCDDPDGNSIIERSKRLKKVIAPFSADIIGFQEYRPAWEKPIRDIFLKKYEIFNIYRAKSELESSPILWKKDKFTLLKADYFWFSETPNIESKGWDEVYDCYRMCVCLHFKENTSGKFFWVLNTHFGFGDSGQVKSVRLINDYCSRISDEPVCILGDFNMKPESPGYKEMIKYFDDTNLLTANDFRNTYHGYDKDAKKGEHIDYCFVNEKFVPKKRKLIDKTVRGKFPSDHYGIYIEMCTK